MGSYCPSARAPSAATARRQWDCPESSTPPDGRVSSSTLNRRVIEAVERLQAADPDTVIVLMADHGYVQEVQAGDPQARFANLFAAYTPDSPGLLADPPTPVNLLPRLLNHYLGTESPDPGGPVLPVPGSLQATGADRAHRPGGRWAGPRLTAVPKAAAPRPAQLADALRGAGAHTLDRLEHRPSLVLQQLRAAGVLPGHWRRLPAGAGEDQPLPVCTRRVDVAGGAGPDLPGSDRPFRLRRHLLRPLRRLRPAGVDHAAIHLRGSRRRDGHDRGGRGAHLRGVRAAGGVPLRHRWFRPRHRGLQRARLHLGAAGGLGRRGGHPVCDPAPPEPSDSPGGGAHRSGRHAGQRVAGSRLELVAVLQSPHGRNRKPAAGADRCQWHPAPDRRCRR